MIQPTRPPHSKHRKFVDAYQAERWLFAASEGDCDVYVDRASDLSIRNYKSDTAAVSLTAAARIYSVAMNMVSADPALALSVELPAPIEVGEDFIVRSRSLTAQPVARLEELDPVRATALAHLAKSQRALERCWDWGQPLVKAVLKQTLTDYSHVFWSGEEGRIVIPDLVMTDEQLSDPALSTLEAVGHGLLMVGHRPKLKAVSKMKAAGFSHVVTILSEAEGAKQIGNHVEGCGMSWLWLPQGSASVPTNPQDAMGILGFVQQLSALFSAAGDNNKPSIYLHCAAGIHRTGMISYALLRQLGYSRIEAMGQLTRLRPLSALEIGLDRVNWIDSILTANTP